MSYEDTLGHASKTLAEAVSKAEPTTSVPSPPTEQVGADAVAERSLQDVKLTLVNVTGVLKETLAREAETVAEVRDVLERLERLYRLELSRKRSPASPNLGWRLALSAVFGSMLTTLLLFIAVSLGK